MAELLLNGAWHRHEGKTYLVVRVPNGADLSCRATTEDAVRAVLAGHEFGPDPRLVPEDEGDGEDSMRQERLRTQYETTSRPK